MVDSVTEMGCKKCGAPMKIPFGTSVFTCEYCGNSMTVGGDGGNWKEIQKHTMLLNKLTPEQVSIEAKKWMDSGILRVGVSKSAVIGQMELKYVPYWIIPANGITNYTGKKGMGLSGIKSAMNQGSQGNIGGLAMGLLGGGFDRMMNNGNARPVSSSINRSYNLPVIAARGLEQYEIKDYQFSVMEKQLFDPGKIAGAKVLNGDVSEAEAKDKSKGMIAEVQEKEANNQLDFVQSMSTNVSVQDGELLHAAIWFIDYTIEGKTYIILIDGSNGKIIKGGKPFLSIN